MTFADAAEKVLQEKGEPIHYKELARQVLSRELVASRSQRPEITLHAVISLENRSRASKGESPRFIIEKGLVGLATWRESKAEIDIRSLVAKRKAEVKRELIAKLVELGGEQFPYFVAGLLEQTGSYTNVEVVDAPGDEGIDIICESQFGINKLKTAVQAKCQNTTRRVGPNVVRLLRDVLPNRGCAQGVIVTTTRFDPKAVAASTEANRPHIILIDGDQLAELALDNGFGVRTEYISLYSLDPDLIGSVGTEDP